MQSQTWSDRERTQVGYAPTQSRLLSCSEQIRPWYACTGCGLQGSDPVVGRELSSSINLKLN
eukprot:362032-Chlamydomonas_euryale.AAC.6